MSQLDELREIIIGDSATELSQLKERIEDVERRTHDVAEVLSPAIEKEVQTGGDSLANSLQKPVSLSLKRAIRSEPAEYAEILYPVMAPSIRRAIAQAISSMMVTINRTIESATTVQGLSLRYESIRTGIPYAELALRQTLLYRVEHLYLIHRDLGMAIASVHADDTQSLDSDAVSAMFSAIQSFVQDSFSRDESSRLTDLKVGDHNVWVVHGQRGMLACVIRGDAPESLKGEMYDTLDLVRAHYANAMVDFDGDATPFEGVELLMSPLLQSEIKNSDGQQSNKQEQSKTLGATLLGVAVLGAFLYFLAQWFGRQSDISTVEHYLREAPGIATTQVYWRDGKLIIEGLKDPDAVIPYETFQAYDIEMEVLQFNMTPFRSLEVEMEVQRFNNELQLPKGVRLSVENGVIELIGEAPLKWLFDNDARLRQLAADRRLSIQKLSASVDSVLRMLKVSFPNADLDDVNARLIKSELDTVVQISGQIDAKNLPLIKTLLASNDWVSISANAK